jgi:hypothetical protein
METHNAKQVTEGIPAEQVHETRIINAKGTYIVRVKTGPVPPELRSGWVDAFGRPLEWGKGLVSKKNLHAYTYNQLEARIKELGCDEPIIEGLLKRQQFMLMVGDSGLGKSPLLYLAACCVSFR